MKTFAPREDLIREGDKPHVVNLVLEGWAQRYKQLPNGRRQILSFFIPGDLCDANVFILKEMDHSVSAVTKLTIAEISRTDFEAMMESSPRISQALWWKELVTVAVQREWTTSLGQRTAYERIAHLMCEMFIRLRTIGMTADNCCEFPLTQTEIADAAGLTPVHVNRTLQQLRNDGLIDLDHKRLTIHDFGGLMKAAMFNPTYLHLEREGAHLDGVD
ncbi:MAG: Crp/Fnr family transcriptional regulator [Parasphingopyxis sp.]|uniref:Crp/Fnr family transcriptional regulator n=1 Tax=Parasphingopyxis sp. TaxID=1920299 RepID=UPI0032ECFB80